MWANLRFFIQPEPVSAFRFLFKNSVTLNLSANMAFPTTRSNMCVRFHHFQKLSLHFIPLCSLSSPLSVSLSLSLSLSLSFSLTLSFSLSLSLHECVCVCVCVCVCMECVCMCVCVFRPRTLPLRTRYYATTVDLYCMGCGATPEPLLPQWSPEKGTGAAFHCIILVFDPNRALLCILRERERERE